MVHFLVQEFWLQETKTSFFEESYASITIKHTRTCVEKGKNNFIYGIIFSNLHWLMQFNKNSNPFSFCTLSVDSKATRFPQSQTTILSSLSTLDGIQVLWLRKIFSKNWQKNPKNFWQLGACSGARDKKANSHLARVQITPHQQGTMEMRDEVLSSGGAQDMLQAGIRCPIGRILSFSGRILTWTRMQSSSQSEILLFPFLILVILKWVLWLKTRLWLTNSKTRRTLLFFQQLQSPRDQPIPLCWWETVPFGINVEIVPDYAYEFYWNNLYFCYSEYNLKTTVINLFQFFKKFSKSTHTCVGQTQF